jgi:hypothetical protein
MLTAKRQNMWCLWSCGLACLLVGLWWSPGLAQDIELQVPANVIQNRWVALVVEVENAQGQPLDGVPVEFQVDPVWEGDAVIAPQQTVTRSGMAQVQFRADLIGVVPVTARVGSQTDTATIWVNPVPNSPNE